VKPGLLIFRGEKKLAQDTEADKLVRFLKNLQEKYT